MTRRRLSRALLGLPLVLQASLAADEVDFQLQIRPILSDNCFHCHGPDHETRKAGLRLDRRADAMAVRRGYAAVVPGDLARSELFRRITSRDPDERMPPPDSGRSLAPGQLELVQRWIEQGASWDEHWAFVRPSRPPFPEAGNALWARNGIDRFALARLVAAGMRPSPPADRAALLRRVALDLTGLPPALEEIDRFLNDRSPDAYERLVDRLLDSPRYGERMATSWLDAARYADTNGYSIDNGRDVWRWRDWVIDTINANVPFDRFTVEQLAGDLLPNPTLEQRIATGFNRNHLVNTEAGSIPEEFRTQYVVDRVHTTATVWLGLTMQCAQCHDHKYDPMSREDFYRFFAFFNTIDEAGLDGYLGNPRPRLRVPDSMWEARREDLEREIAAAEARLAAQSPRIGAAQSQWLAELRAAGFREPQATEALWGFDGTIAGSRPGSPASSPLRGEPRFHAEGVMGLALEIDSDRAVVAPEAGDIRPDRPFAMSLWIWPQSTGRFVMLSRMDESDFSRGWDLYCVNRRVHFRLVERWPERAIRVSTPPTVTAQRWQHLAVSWDGSGRAEGVRIWVDGVEQPREVSHDSLTGSTRVQRPLVIGPRDSFFNFTGRFDQVRTIAGALSEDDVVSLRTEPILAPPGEDRGSADAQARFLRHTFLSVAAPADLRRLHRRLQEARLELDRHLELEPTVMVMREQDNPRQTFVLERGQYDRPGERVTPGTPNVLPPMPAEAPANRLGLARWLVSPENPLTARVTVNRRWQHFFGHGLVRTPEDFGAQGEPPTHPELLDWLATELVRTGWDLKAMDRLIVTSATYRQSSTPDSQSLEHDPDNRLLSRGPRMRLDAEVIRDQALSAAGLLMERLGGPPIRPYQPPGLWEELSIDPLGERWTAQVYRQDRGPALYRRSVYMFRKRTAPPPGLELFDTPNREVCTVRRGRTNTPLQALVTMNDPTYAEAARALAERMIAAGTAADEGLRVGWRLVLTREPTRRELEVLRDALRRQRDWYGSRRSDAQALIRVGESSPSPNMDPVKLAAWTMVASAILNLDEALTSP